MAKESRRPRLTRRSPPSVLADFYWLKEELCEFARENGLPVSGKKLEIRKRIERFLRDGTRPKRRRPKKSSPAGWDSERPITRRRLVRRWKCDAATRAFFVSQLGDSFHFTVALNKRGRSGEAGLTYGDLVRAWTAEREQRRDPKFKASLGKSGEYNIYVRAFFADGKNSGKTISHAAKAWKRRKTKRGPRVYRKKDGW